MEKRIIIAIIAAAAVLAIYKQFFVSDGLAIGYGLIVLLVTLIAMHLWLKLRRSD